MLKINSTFIKKYQKKKYFKKIFKLKHFDEIYDYIIFLNKIKFLMSNNMKNNNNIISDCQNKSWFEAILIKNKILLYGYSKSLIINGLISLMFLYYDNVKAFRINNLFFNKFIYNYKSINNFLIKNRLKYLENFEKFLKLKINIILNNL